MNGVSYGSTGDFIFREAVAFLKGKTALTSSEYKKLSEMAATKAFTVSGYTKVETIQKFLDTLAAAVEGGWTLEQWRQAMDTYLVDKGYEGVHPWNADVIFRTNLQTAFNAGHYTSMQKAKRLRPYWQYKTAYDGKVRETHARMHDLVFAADDPVWRVWYPPNGFRCRCYVISLTKAQVERQGLTVETKVPYDVDYTSGEMKMPMPDAGFGHNPALREWRPDLSRVNGSLREIYQEKQKAGKP